MVQRLTEEQLLAVAKPHSGGLQSHERSNPRSGQIQCPSGKCALIISSSEKLKKRNKSLRFSCDICGIIFNRKGTLKLHIERHFRLQSLKCDFPGCVYSSKVTRDFIRHKTRVHPSILYTCLLCGKNLKMIKSYNYHVSIHKTETPGVFKCGHKGCKKLFINGDNLRKHFNEAHEDMNQIQCIKRSKFFDTNRQLRFSCDVCGANLKRKYTLKRHIERHTHLRLLKCDVPGCLYSGKVSRDLYRHKKRVHSSILYTCLLCGKNFKRLDNYKYHVAIHKTEMPGAFKCHYRSCQMRFENGDDLTKHFKKAHEDIIKFQCNKHSKGFATNMQLQEHEKLHRDEKPFVVDCTNSDQNVKSTQPLKNNVLTISLFTCSHCGKMFKSSEKFKKHIQKHQFVQTGVYKCLRPGCRKKLTSLFDLREHVDAHYGVQRFTCHECGNLTVSKEQLQQHMLQHFRIARDVEFKRDISTDSGHISSFDNQHS
jgi:KRAB domain-containing zinc finger protein